MTADEARSISESKRKVNIDEALSSINHACFAGGTYVWHNKPLNQKQKDKLERLGYGLYDEKFNLNEYLIKISW